MTYATFKQIIKKLFRDLDEIEESDPEAIEHAKDKIRDLFEKLSEDDRLLVFREAVFPSIPEERIYESKRIIQENHDIEMTRLKMWFIKISTLTFIFLFLSIIVLLVTVDVMKENSSVVSFLYKAIDLFHFIFA